MKRAKSKFGFKKRSSSRPSKDRIRIVSERETIDKFRKKKKEFLRELWRKDRFRKFVLLARALYYLPAAPEGFISSN